MKTEAEVVRAVLSELTHAPFVVIPPRPYDLSKKPRWYVTCLDGYYYEKTTHSDTVWADQEGTIWIESTHLGSPTSWAEQEYGERGAVQVMDMSIDYKHLTLAQIQARLKVLPKLSERVGRYIRTAGKISHRSGIPVELVFDARADLGWFLFKAKVAPKDASELEGEIRKAVAAMKEIYELTEGAHYRNLLSRF